MNRSGRRLLFALALVVALTAGGTVGYMLIERMTFEDALFMTVITITTVGYGQVRPLDNLGLVFTMTHFYPGRHSLLCLRRLDRDNSWRTIARNSQSRRHDT